MDFTVSEHENICIAGLNCQAGYAIECTMSDCGHSTRGVLGDHSLFMAGGGLVISTINQKETSGPPLFKNQNIHDPPLMKIQIYIKLALHFVFTFIFYNQY